MIYFIYVIQLNCASTIIMSTVHHPPPRGDWSIIEYNCQPGAWSWAVAQSEEKLVSALPPSLLILPLQPPAASPGFVSRTGINGTCHPASQIGFHPSALSPGAWERRDVMLVQRSSNSAARGTNGHLPIPIITSLQMGRRKPLPGVGHFTIVQVC